MSTLQNTGPEAILRALEAIDLDALEEEQREVIRQKKKTARPRAVRLINIIGGLRKNEITPSQLMIRQVPVIPPKFRPFAITGNTFLPGDANELYKDLVEYRRLYERTSKELGEENAGEVYADMNAAVRAAYGYGDSPNPKTRARAVKGFFQTVTGTSPKTSIYQSKMLSKPVDTVGRGVIIPDADYDMDDVGIPEEMGWKLYGNYAQRSLVRGGMSPGAALKHVKDRSPQALKALESTMKDRPVVITRSPAWHKFNVVGQNARLVKGDAIRINTFITEGQNADFDGDFQDNQVVTTVDYDLPLHKGWTDLGRWSTNPDMFSKLLIPRMDDSKRVIITDLQDFPRAQHSYSKEGTNGPIHFHAVPAGTKVVAFDEESNRPVWADVSAYSEHPGRVVEIVSLTNRKQIFTDDDPRAVYGISTVDPSMKLQRFTPTAALAASVVVPVMKHTDALTEPSIDCVDVVGKSIELTRDFGYLLGALCGDGWWDKKPSSINYGGCQSHQAICIADLNGAVAEEVDRQLTLKFGAHRTARQENFKVEGDDRYGDTVKYTFVSDTLTKVANWLTAHLGGERCEKSAGSANKRIPGFAYTAPREFREGLITGLIDTDGTCAISNAKDKPQLMISFGSTSLRLAREVSAICRTLGISAPVSFSKETSGGNTAWTVTLSTVDSKREGFLYRLQNAHKRDNFANTPVSDTSGSELRDAVVLPAHIKALLAEWVPFPKIKKSEREAPNDDVTRRMHHQNLYVQLRNSGGRGLITHQLLAQIEQELRKIRSEASADLLRGRLALVAAIRDGGFDQGRADDTRDAVRAVSPKQDTKDRYTAGCLVAARVNAPLRAGKITPKVAQGILDWLDDTPRIADPLESEPFKMWRARFVDTDVEWAAVESVEYTGKKEDGYDLTVPGYETFMSADGVILSNTSSIHVPSTPEAVRDVQERMMASKMLWSIKDRNKVLAAPKHEQILGLSMGHDAGGTKRKFATDDEAMKAIEEGQIDLNDDIEIGE